MHFFIESNYFTEEKFKFLIKNGAELMMDNSYAENFIDKILKMSYYSERLANNALIVFRLAPEYDRLREVVSRAPNLMKDLKSFLDLLGISKNRRI